jgi:hypothetical protein
MSVNVDGRDMACIFVCVSPVRGRGRVEAWALPSVVVVDVGCTGSLCGAKLGHLLCWATTCSQLVAQYRNLGRRRTAIARFWCRWYRGSQVNRNMIISAYSTAIMLPLLVKWNLVISLFFFSASRRCRWRLTHGRHYDARRP